MSITSLDTSLFLCPGIIYWSFIKPKLNCKNIFPIDLAPNGVPFNTNMAFNLVPNQSERCNYNPNLVRRFQCKFSWRHHLLVVHLEKLRLYSWMAIPDSIARTTGILRHRLSKLATIRRTAVERLASLSILGVQLRAPLKPLEHHNTCDIEVCKGDTKYATDLTEEWLEEIRRSVWTQRIFFWICLETDWLNFLTFPIDLAPNENSSLCQINRRRVIKLQSLVQFNKNQKSCLKKKSRVKGVKKSCLPLQTWHHFLFHFWLESFYFFSYLGPGQVFPTFSNKNSYFPLLFCIS